MIEQNIIRVFPRKTKWTPDDKFAFVGDPPLFKPDGDLSVFVSCSFTWDIPEAERLFQSWSKFYSNIQIGGPAFDDPGETFTPGLFVKPGIVFTSRGCSKNCAWCFASKREGWIRELPITAGYDVADNNLLACSRGHIEAVFDMLRQQPEPIKLSGGLDAEILQPWHVDLLKTIRLKFAWFACDYPGALPNIERVADLMADFSIEKKRCYVLIGFNGETVRQAEKRLESIYKLNFLPMSMLYRNSSIKQDHWSDDWLKLRRTWSRPAAFRREMANRV